MLTLVDTVMSIDWLSLTVWLPYSKLDKYLAVAGVLEGLEHSGHGTRGFHDLYVGLAGFSVGASPVMGDGFCSLVFPGQACDHVGVERLRQLVALLAEDGVRFRPSRFDVALDTQKFEVAAVAEAEAADLVQCNAVVFDERKNVDRGSGALIGHTIYVGSRQSDAMLRIYHKADGDSFGSEPFTRLEMEYKGRRAEMEFLQLMAFDVADWLGIAAASLRGFFDIAADWWRDWLGAAPCWSIKMRRPFQTLERAQRWLKHQVAPTLAAVMIALSDGGDVDLLQENVRLLLDDGIKRMRSRHKRLFELPSERAKTTFAVFGV